MYRVNIHKCIADWLSVSELLCGTLSSINHQSVLVFAITLKPGLLYGKYI